MDVIFLLLKSWQCPFDRAIQCLFRKIKPGGRESPGFAGMNTSRELLKIKIRADPDGTGAEIRIVVVRNVVVNRAEA